LILYESELGFRNNYVSFRTFKGPLFNQKILLYRQASNMVF
jgi:hypothetical protein